MGMTSYMDAELQAGPYEGRPIGFHLRIRVHDGCVLLDALEHPTEVAGDAAAPVRCVGAVELGREGEHLSGARHAAQRHEARFALVAEAGLELDQGGRERIRTAARWVSRKKVPPLSSASYPNCNGSPSWHANRTTYLADEQASAIVE